MINTEKFYTDNIYFMQKTMGEYDMGLLEHSMCVAQVAMDIALEMGVDKKEATIIYMQGLVHDFGKVFIPKEIMLKEGKLTDEEFEIIKMHPELGYEYLNEVGLGELAGPALTHHNREDNTGYGGIEGSFDYASKIVAVADVFSAMIQNRVYSNASSLAQAGAEINRVAGTQLNERVVQAFNRVLIRDYLTLEEVERKQVLWVV